MSHRLEFLDAKDIFSIKSIAISLTLVMILDILITHFFLYLV